MVYNLFMTTHWSNKEYQEFLRRTSDEVTPSAKLLNELGVATLVQKPKASRKKKQKVDPLEALINPEQGVEQSVAPKRAGSDPDPIINSLRHCVPQIQCDKGDLPVLSIWLEGARVLSINQIFDMLQTRKYKIFRYKKAWQSLIRRALMLIPKEDRPYFEGPVKIQLVRRAKRLLDDDATRIVFKHAIDALVKEKILLDDNRNVVVEIEPWDYKGSPALGIRVIALAERPVKREIFPEKEWFS